MAIVVLFYFRQRLTKELVDSQADEREQEEYTHDIDECDQTFLTGQVRET